MKSSPFFHSIFIGVLLGGNAFSQSTGPSTASSPYVIPSMPGYETISVLTVDNTGANPDDMVPRVGGGTYGMDGIPDGLGAFDNGDGTFTLLMNHELGAAAGVIRAHGAIGTYVSKFVVDKNTLQVISGQDLMKQVYDWDTALQRSNTIPSIIAFNRFCSGDLPAISAFYNSKSGLGSTARIYLHGEEGGATGSQLATVATGANAGKSYILGKFNLSTNGSGLVGTGAWENALACPFPQDKTIVIGNNDGGTGLMTNALSVYIGSKRTTGSEVDKAGLTNGTMSFVNVVGNPVEIINTTTRVTNITSGTRFTLSNTSSTTFSRPEDGAWNPKNPKEYYFVTTDRLDQASDGTGAQIGQTRLWRLTFDDIASPGLGGKIDLLINGRTINGEKVNMFDNLTVNEKTGALLIQEDVGGAPHNGKLWDYDPSSDTLFRVAKHDATRFGDVSLPATAPFSNDEEMSGIIDISSIMATSGRANGNPGEAWSISSDQAHYTSGITLSQVEGGQLFILHELSPVNNVTVSRGGYVRDRRTGAYAQQVTITNLTSTTLSGPFYLILDSLSTNAAVVSPAGTTSVYGPLGAPYITISTGTLSPAASASITLQFANPSNGTITYSARVLNSIPTP